MSPCVASCTPKTLRLPMRNNVDECRIAGTNGIGSYQHQVLCTPSTACLQTCHAPCPHISRISETPRRPMGMIGRSTNRRKGKLEVGTYWLRNNWELESPHHSSRSESIETFDKKDGKEFGITRKETWQLGGIGQGCDCCQGYYDMKPSRKALHFSKQGCVSSSKLHLSFHRHILCTSRPYIPCVSERLSYW